MTLVAWPDQRPTLSMAPDRETVLANAYAWIDRQLASDKNPE